MRFERRGLRWELRDQGASVILNPSRNPKQSTQAKFKRVTVPFEFLFSDFEFISISYFVSLSLHPHVLHHLSIHLLDVHPLGFRAVVDQDAVAKRGGPAARCRRSRRAPGRRAGPALWRRGSGTWRRAQAGAPAHPLVDEVRRSRLARARRRGEPHGVADHVLGDRHLAGTTSWKRSTSSPVNSGSIGFRLARWCRLHDRDLVVLRQVVDDAR